VPRPNTSVQRIAEAVLKLATTPLPFRPTATVRALFSSLGAALSVPASMRELNEANVQRMMELLPQDLRYYVNAITRDTAVPTGLEAGQKINVIPSEATARVDGRYLPGQTAEGFLEEVRQVIGNGYTVEPLDMTLPLEDPPGDALYETIVSVMKRRAPEALVVPAMLSGATDAKHVARLGTKCLGFGPLRVPEGFPVDHLIHGHDERIPVDGYIWGIEVMHDIVTTFCA
jgi:acetylornithine deacetylase/succinyl-diaminopimelate desuccinylase-like protein